MARPEPKDSGRWSTLPRTCRQRGCDIRKEARLAPSRSPGWVASRGGLGLPPFWGSSPLPCRPPLGLPVLSSLRAFPSAAPPSPPIPDILRCCFRGFPLHCRLSRSQDTLPRSLLSTLVYFYLWSSFLFPPSHHNCPELGIPLPVAHAHTTHYHSFRLPTTR